MIVPAYGHAEYILQTLDSVFAQTFQDFEIIVVNDGSPDSTEDVLKSLIEAQKIRYIFQKNAGVATARNVGFSHSIGKYIAFLDDDDIWPPDKLEWQVKELESGVAVAIGGSTGLVGPGGQLVPSTEVAGKARLLDYEEFFDGNPFTSPGQVLIRRDAIMKIGGFDTRIWGTDDLDFFMSLANEGFLLRVPILSLYYRIHRSNASHDHLKMILNSKVVVMKQLCGLSGKKKRRCRRRGYRWMFRYQGGALISDIQKELKARPYQLRKTFSVMVMFVRVFGGQMLLDPGLCRIILVFLWRSFRKFPGTKLIQGSHLL